MAWTCSRRAARWLSIGSLVAVCAAGSAQAQSGLTLTVTVLDPTGAVIVGARVDVAPDDPAAGAAASADTGSRGEAAFALTGPGRYTIHAEALGFEPYEARNVRVRGNDARRTVRLSLAKVLEIVEVGPDARERASDPRGDAFATVLGQAEIDELPDDPDEMERALQDMAGPGSVIRVNGFRGGRLPPKEQIAQVRFRRNMFAAEAHEPGFIAVDIITKPGLDAWRGSASTGFRDSRLNARNPLAPDRGDERHERAAMTMSGPLWRKHTSIAFAADGANAFDTQTIVGALPSGLFAQSVRRPNDAANLSARIEHGLAASRQLRVELQRNYSYADNLGVGAFDLSDRAYRQAKHEHVVRGSLTGSLGRRLYNELRASWQSRETTTASASDAATVTVQNAFTSGGAQYDGSSAASLLELSSDVDFAAGRHALRTGFRFERGRYRTAERRNTTGTYTFADLDAYAAGRPTTFSRTTGDPEATVAQVQSGVYAQDDLRVSRSLTLSGGIRQEYQSHIGGLHLGPRGGFVWSPFRNGRTTVRGGTGLFFDWFDADDYLRAVQLDGAHQQIETIVNPAYPEGNVPSSERLPAATGGEAVVLPNGRMQVAPSLAQPTLHETSIGVEHALTSVVRLNAMLMRRRGSHGLRGIDVNAPGPSGVRSDPAAGPITEIRSIASSSFDGLSFNVNVVRPDRRIFVAANYLLSRSIDEVDSPFGLPADAGDLQSERGPSLDAARHRAMGFASFPLARALAAGVSFRVQSALPYNITTGRDDNGDTISSDRPAGVPRNAGRGRAVVDTSLRLSYRRGFGGPPAAPPNGTPQVRVVRGGDANPLGDMPMGLDQRQRFVVELYAQVFNVMNHLNATTFGGVVSSPLFGRPVSASSPRRIELGARFTF